MSFEAALNIAATGSSPYDLSIIEQWFVKLQEAVYWPTSFKAQLKGLQSFLRLIWCELNDLTKMRMNNFFAQIEGARTKVRIIVQDLVTFLPSTIDLFELWLIDNKSVEWTKSLYKDALDSAFQLIREVTNSQSPWPAMLRAIGGDPRFDKVNWDLMIGERQGRILRAFVCLKNEILDVKAYNTEGRHVEKLPRPLTPNDLLDISFELKPPARRVSVPPRLQPDGITRRLVKLENFKTKRFTPAPRTVEELQHAK